MSEFAEQMQNKEKIKFITARVSKYFFKMMNSKKIMGLWNTKAELVEDCLEELQKFLDSCPNLQTLQLYSVCAFQQLILLFRKYFIEQKKNSNLSFLQNISNASHKTRV